MGNRNYTMNSIYGIFSRNSKTIPDNQIQLLINRLSSRQNSIQKSFNYSYIWLGIVYENNSSKNKIQHQLPYASNNNFIVLFEGRIDNREELENYIDRKSKTRFISDSELILLLYKKFESDIFNKMLGDFAFVIWDGNNTKLVCVRDYIGTKSLYYYLSDDLFVFCSEIKGLLTIDKIPKEIDDQYIADSLSGFISDQSRTMYNHIKRLPPANFLTIRRNDTEFKKYWELNLKNEIIYDDESQYIEKLNELLHKSVICRLEPYFGIGTELSGGLDSSGVTAVGFKEMANRNRILHTFTHTLPDEAFEKIKPFHDEREEVKLTCNYLGIYNNNTIDAHDKNLLNTLINNIEIHGMPTQQHYHTFSDALYESVIRNNINILLSGFGGNELISYQGSGFYHELLNNNKFKILYRELKARKKNVESSLIKQIIYLFLEVYFPSFHKAYKGIKGRKHWIEIKYMNAAINPSFEEKMNIRQKIKQLSNQIDSFILKEAQFKQISHDHISQRLEYSGITAKHYGFEYCYPLLDRRLVEFGLAIPNHLKVKDGWGRYLYRKVLEDLLPAEIVWKQKGPGASIPSVMYRFLKDREKIHDLINESDRKGIAKEYIDYKKLKEWFNRIISLEESEDRPLYPSLFINYLELICFMAENN